MTRWVKLSLPKWAFSPPTLFDIVVGYYPESKPKAGTPAHRPCLVTHVYQDALTGEFACEIAYGTKHLKTVARIDRDIIIQNYSDLDAMGLPVATRFNLDLECRVVLEWKPPNFKPWSGHKTPRIGALTLQYQKDYAWIMARQATITR